MGVIKIKSLHRVKPAEPTWQGVVPLSVLDNTSVITHTSVLYFYDKPTREEWLNPSSNTVINTLKDSLSRALVAYYPLAGRARYIGGGRFELDCNAKGAVLLEVESSMKITDFGELYFARKRIPELLYPLNYYETPIEKIPVLAVQVTRFACGGFCLGISTSHLVADGRSAFRFQVEWARLAMGEPPLKVEPTFDRARLILDDDKPHHYYHHEPKIINYFIELRLNQKNWAKLVEPSFIVLDKKMIERLKEAAKDDNGERPYSRFEVIAAHVWRCACKARELKLEEIAILTIPAAIHDRMDPPLPSSFIGNAVVEAEASSRVEELLSKPLSYACSLVRGAIKNLNNDYIINKIKFLEQKTSLSKYQYIDDGGIMEGPSDGDNCITIVSWLNLKNGEIDFGWGKEIQMVPSLVQTCDGEIQFSSYGNDGSVVVDACLQPKEKFVKYVSSTIE